VFAPNFTAQNRRIGRYLLRGAIGVNKLESNLPKGHTHMAFTGPLTAQDSLTALMILVSASDTNMRTSELIEIHNAINTLPIFAGYDADNVTYVSQAVFDFLEQEDGLEAIFGLTRDVLPERLHETAYALACDVAAADGKTGQAELRVLEEIRYELRLDPLHAAAIERGAKARHMTL